MPAHGCNFMVTVVWKSPFSTVKFCGPVTPPWHVLTTALSLGTQSLLWLDRSGPAAGHDLGTLCRQAPGLQAADLRHLAVESRGRRRPAEKQGSATPSLWGLGGPL